MKKREVFFLFFCFFVFLFFFFSFNRSSKSRSSKSEIEDWLLREGAGKNSVLVACGGGVVGDLTGFVASSFYRGVPVVQIPTSLLAMVDSSIGGKTAIDVWAGKNLIGAFHHPLLVAIDVELLRTLPLKQLMNGMAEVIKVAVALDAAFFSYLERADIAKLVAARDEETLLYIVKRSAELKAGIVEGDERDAGRRNILNLGHTVGHAIEHLFSWLHGEAVASGMVCTFLCLLLCFLDERTQKGC
jgi:3-dehydroquinate synthetase